MEKELIVSTPQNVKLSLNNGVLTLEAGSKAYMPNGVGVFTECTNTTNLTYSPIWGAGYKCYVTGYVGANGALAGIGMCRGDLQFSGPTAPAATIGGTIWYDTVANKIKTYRSGTWVVDSTSEPRCLFLGVISVGDGNVITSIDEVFNSFGRIGSSIFALPNIMGEVPYGIDSDGLTFFKSYVTESVLVAEKKSDYPFLVGKNNVFTDIYFANSFNNYQNTSNLFFENGKPIYGVPLDLNKSKIDISGIATTKLISQYANSEKILRLANGIRTMFNNAKLISDWYNIVYNLKTAKGFGLDIWGKILNQGRSFKYTNQTTGVVTEYYLKGEITVDGTTFSAEEVEELYRKILFMKVISLITNATDKSLNELLQFYFDGRRVYVIQYDTMKLRYVFEIAVNKLEKSIFTSGLLPKPTGVGATFVYLPKNQYFGFYVNSREQNDQYWAPFDNKPFYW